MNGSAILTIDDSPSPRSSDLLDFLKARDIPAIFFCRGDRLEEDRTHMVRAVTEGHTLGNHLYSHRRASKLVFDEICAEIEKMEKLIDQVYSDAGVKKTGKYVRFPHLDRGCGGWNRRFRSGRRRQSRADTAVLVTALNIDLSVRPSVEQIELKDSVQRYLRESGYLPPSNLRTLTQEKGVLDAIDLALHLFDR